MGLIDADAVFELFKPFKDALDDEKVKSAYIQTLTLIHNAPSIDIVFCKECKWATEARMKSIEGDVIYLKTCPSRTEVIDDDDFCSYGERREP